MLFGTKTARAGATSSKVTQRKARSSRQISITFERLEDRRLLAAYTVDTLLDDASGISDGMISLREAVTAANTNAAFGDAVAGDADGDSIVFSAALDGQTISLSNGHFLLIDDLTIGDSGARVAIDANNLSRAFIVDGIESWSFSNLEIRNGLADTVGGGICFTGTGEVLVSNVSFVSNRALGAGGGGFYNQAGTVEIVDSTFRENSANGVSGTGGALLTDAGDVMLFNVVMDLNVATRAGGGVEIVDGSLQIINSSLIANFAGQFMAGNPGNGGAVHVTGASGTEVVVSNTLVQDNLAQSEGGGLWNQAGSRLIVRDGSRIINNTASGNEADNGGGGLFNNGGLLRVLDSEVSGNTADGLAGSGGGILSTGGILNIRRSIIAGNTANRAGGGIEVIDGYAKLQDSTLGGPLASDGNVAGPAGTAAPGNGGGLHVSGTNGTLVNIDNTRVSNNFAAREGGGLWNQAGSQLIVENNSIVIANSAAGSAADDGGGGIFNNGGNVNIVSATIDGNLATGGSASGGGILTTDGTVLLTGSLVQNNVANRAGGGVEIINGAIVITNSQINTNVAGPSGSAAPGNGGGLHVTGTSNTFTLVIGSQVSSNVAANEGGGLWNAAGSKMVVRTGSVISNNIASGDNADDGGGGLFNNGGLLRILDSVVSDNTADGLAGSGGGILSVDGILNIRRSAITSNVANRAGGGVEVVNGVAILLDSVLGGSGVNGNIAGPAGTAVPGNGGGLHVSGISGTTVAIDGGAVLGNIAANQGGGLWNQIGSFLTVRNGAVVTDNSALSLGGGLYGNGGSTFVIDSVFTNNDATDGGGLFFEEGAKGFLDTPSISNNTAMNNGGGIFNSGTVSIFDGGTITGNTAGNTGGGIFTSATGTTDEGDVVNTGNTPNDRN